MTYKTKVNWGSLEKGREYGWLLYVFFALIFCLLLFKAGFISGIADERRKNVCVDAKQINLIEKSLELSNAVCVTIQSQQIDKINAMTKENNDECFKDVKYWKGLYQKILNNTTTQK